ncbi:hypothetical protein [Corynebacterium halotolerans]|uniref:Secreted protein n=1 Tax=Corynebacterium halotolerans YIM 70093 = DSM 44683 TaxID=1121362 RepID=M1NVC9_9CORY|nr:hypothetical protein [Corynebacterium halotolerans]AGF71445.1 hypothetical protein A605_02155 [Corynebacterium halotolerans YIM 70093 = DSM 44683]
MPNFKRSLLSLTIAAGLAVSGTGVATAQSSNLFAGSSSSSTADKPGNNDDFQGRWPAHTIKGQYEAAYAKALKKQGLKQDEELNAFAEDVADRLASGELEYDNGYGYTLTWVESEDGRYAAEITRLTNAEALAYLPRMDELLEDLLVDKDPSDDRLGYAVSSDNGHVYLVVSGPISLSR